MVANIPSFHTCLDPGWSIRHNLFSINKCQHCKDWLALHAPSCSLTAVTQTDNKQLHHRGRSQPIHHGSNSRLPPSPSLYSPFIYSSDILLFHHSCHSHNLCLSAFAACLWRPDVSCLQNNKEHQQQVFSKLSSSEEKIRFYLICYCRWCLQGTASAPQELGFSMNKKIFRLSIWMNSSKLTVRTSTTTTTTKTWLHS